MKKVEKLTPQQEEYLVEFRQEWLDYGLSTAPANRAEAESTILAMYAEIGRPAPLCLWAQSPLQANLLLNFMKSSGQLHGQLHGQLRGQLYDQLHGQLRGQLGDQLHGQLGDQLRGQLRGQLYDQLRGQLYDQLRGQLNLEYFYTSFWGQQDAYWIAYFLFPQQALGIQYPANQSKILDWWTSLAQSCNWVWTFENLCVLSDRPSSLSFDNRQRLHNESGPAFSFSDGWNGYYWHGTRVASEIILRPELISVERIQKEPNVEMRRILIERYDEVNGQGAYIIDAGGKIVHRDGFGTLYRIERPNDEPLLMVKVLNSTLESDGTRREFFLRVDPQLRPMEREWLPSDTLYPTGPVKYGRPQALTAHAAVASTFGKRAEEYQPDFES